MRKLLIFGFALGFAIAAPGGGILHAQSSLILSSAEVAPAGSALLELTLSSNPDNRPAGIQWTFRYPAPDVSVWSVVAGPALTASGKTITCASGVTPNRGIVIYTCLATGLNANPIPDGVIANVTASLSSTTAAGIEMVNSLGASIVGSAISIAATGDTVTPASLESMACAPATLLPGITGSCTVSLTAVSSGAVVSLKSSKEDFLTPASVTIPPGSNSATFAFTAGRSLYGWVTLSASLGSVTKVAAFRVKRVNPLLSMRPSETSADVTTPVSFSCNPTFLVAGQSVICELRLLTPVRDSVQVEISSNSGNLNVPEALSFHPGQRRLRFEVNAVPTAGFEAVLLTAGTGSNVTTERLTIAPAAAPSIHGAPPQLTKLHTAGGTAPAACIPGSVATIEGDSLLDRETDALSDFSGSATSLGGSQVLVNGAPSHLLYASSERIDFLCPELPPGTPIEIHLETARATSSHFYGTVADRSPGVLTVDGTGTGQALAVREGSSDVAALPNFRFPATPALPDDLLSIQVTGVECSAVSRGVLFVRLAGQTIQPSLVHPMKGDAGICQVSFLVPSGVSGDNVPLTIESIRRDGIVVTSNLVSIVVEPDQ